MGSVDPWLQSFSSRPMLLSHQHLMRLDSSIIEESITGDPDGDTFLGTTFEMPAVAPNSVLMRALPLKKAYTKMKPHLLSHVVSLPAKQQQHLNQGTQHQPSRELQLHQDHLKGDEPIKTEASDENRFLEGDQDGADSRLTVAHISSTGPPEIYGSEFKETDEAKASSTIIPNPEIANKALLVAERVTRQAIQSGAAKSRQPKCAVCRNHRQEVPLRGHKRFCPYKNCKCENCLLIAKRRDIMAKQVALRRAQAQDEALGLTPCSPEPSSQGNMTPVTPGPSTPVGSKPASPTVSQQDDLPPSVPASTHNRQSTSTVRSAESREVQYNYKKKTSAARLEALKLSPEMDDCRLMSGDSPLGSKALEGTRIQGTIDSDRFQQQLNSQQNTTPPENQQQEVWFPSVSESSSATALFNIAPYFSSPNAIEAFKSSMISPTHHFTPSMHPIFSNHFWLCMQQQQQQQQQQQHQSQQQQGSLQAASAVKERLPPVPKLLTNSTLDRTATTMARTCENSFDLCDG